MKNNVLLQKITLIFSLIPVLVGLAVFIGWKLDIPSLKSIFPNQITMKANTAIGMILCGGSIAFLSYKFQSMFYRYIIVVISLLVLTAAILTLLQYIFQFNLGIDEFIIKDKVSTLNIGRMSPSTAFCFFNISMCIMLAAAPTTLRLRKPIIGALSLTVFIISGIIFLSYLPNMLWGYHILKSAYMSIHTAFSLMLLSAASFLLIYKEENFIWNLNFFTTCGSIMGFILILLSADSYYIKLKKMMRSL